MVSAVGSIAPAGHVGVEIMRHDLWIPDRLHVALRNWSPRTDLGRFVRACINHLPAEMAAELIERFSRIVVIESSVAVKIAYPDGRVEDYGVESRKVVTDTGVGFIVDAFQNLVELENMKYHALGTGSTAEGAGQTALVTELTTEYTGNVRATGTTAEAAANIYQTVATNTLDETPGAALREHAVMSQAATGGGVMIDRSLIGPHTVTAPVDVTTTYQLTFTSGG